MENDSDKIWKYMDLAMFISLLSKRALLFRCPMEFEDPFEGYIPKAFAIDVANKNKDELVRFESIRNNGLDFLKEKQNLLENNPNGNAHLAVKTAYEKIENIDSHINDIDNSLIDEIKRNASNHGVNCWHKTDHESDAMWKLYSASGQGVAIESTIGQLKDSIQSHENLEIGSVVYLEENESSKEHGKLGVLLWKRKSFEHEKELRAIIPLKTPKESIFIKCDLEKLINQIHISPLAKPYFIDIVEALCEGQITGLQKPIKRSTLLDKPDYRLKALWQ